MYELIVSVNYGFKRQDKLFTYFYPSYLGVGAKSLEGI